MRLKILVLYTVSAVSHFWHYESSASNVGGEQSPIKAGAFDPTVLLLGFWIFIESKPIYTSGISYKQQWSLLTPINCLLPLVLILFAFSISRGGEFYLSRFTHLILRLCYLDLGALCSPRLQSSPSVFHAGESIYLSHLVHSILWNQCGGESFKVSYIWSGIYHHAENILSGKNFHLILWPIVLSRPICYFHWLSHVLPLYLERKASHSENILNKNSSFTILANSPVSTDCFTSADCYTTTVT